MHNCTFDRGKRFLTNLNGALWILRTITYRVIYWISELCIGNPLSLGVNLWQKLNFTTQTGKNKNVLNYQNKSNMTKFMAGVGLGILI